MSLRQRNPKQDEGRGDDIVELREELLGNIAHDGGGGGGAMKAIKKKARQLLDGQNPKKKKKQQQQQQQKKEREKRNKNRTEEEEQKKQRSWPPNPPPYSFDASFTSAKGCCPLPPIRANPRGAPKKPSNHNLLLRSLIERNDFYCKECNVHLR